VREAILDGFNAVLVLRVEDVPLAIPRHLQTPTLGLLGNIEDKVRGVKIVHKWMYTDSELARKKKEQLLVIIGRREHRLHALTVDSRSAALVT
jgi:hypothetical protein